MTADPARSATPITGSAFTYVAPARQATVLRTTVRGNESATMSNAVSRSNAASTSGFAATTLAICPYAMIEEAACDESAAASRADSRAATCAAAAAPAPVEARGGSRAARKMLMERAMRPCRARSRRRQKRARAPPNLSLRPMRRKSTEVWAAARSPMAAPKKPRLFTGVPSAARTRPLPMARLKGSPRILARRFRFLTGAGAEAGAGAGLETGAEPKLTSAAWPRRRQ
mmetsp:Transcript_28467/g.63547  ORF Transcript_28467/g.63547 Transcript_28467/m.63547 type:complete len:229 (-) Transcript_28467:924-1610(-)